MNPMTDGDTRMEGLHYAGESDGGSFHLFHYLADGKSDGTDSRPVLEVLVDSDDRIWVAGIATDDAPLLVTLPQRTNGSVHRHPLGELDDETAVMLNVTGSVEPVSGICVSSVYAYVYPRIATLMARVYCPAQRIDLADEKWFKG